MSRTRLNTLLKALLSFSPRERRRVLLLLPLLVALCLLFVWQGKPRFEQSFTRYSDRVLDSTHPVAPYSGAGRDRMRGSASCDYDGEYSDHSGSGDYANTSEQTPGSGWRHNSVSSGRLADGTRSFRRDSLFVFDPNTVTQQELVLLGFPPKQAQVILRYREAGAVFRKPEDFARCYTVSREKFTELTPYIHIGLAFRESKTASGRRDSSPGTGSSDPDPTVRANNGTASSGQPWRQEYQAPNNTTRGENFQTRTHPDPSGGDRSPKRSALLELNSADSAALVVLHGIGPLTASRIQRYRQALGGFASVTRLQEIAGMTDQNYQMIIQQIWVDSSKIQKIDINFASPKRMGEHPYFPPKVLNRVLKFRQLKGGWSSTRDLIEQHILSAEQAERLAPYLYFRAL